jgi:hypothetical protein
LDHPGARRGGFPTSIQAWDFGYRVERYPEKPSKDRLAITFETSDYLTVEYTSPNGRLRS